MVGGKSIFVGCMLRNREVMIIFFVGTGDDGHSAWDVFLLNIGAVSACW